MNAKDIVSKEFDTVKRGGYDAAEVDTFLKDVSIEYKKLQNENAELEKKLEVLAEKIREYRKDEDALRDALLIAKKQGIAVVNEAKDDAEKIRKEAQEKTKLLFLDVLLYVSSWSPLRISRQNRIPLLCSKKIKRKEDRPCLEEEKKITIVSLWLWMIRKDVLL